MKASLSEIKKLAQLTLREKGFYSGEIDGIWGKISDAGFTQYSNFLKSKGMKLGEDDAIFEDAGVSAISGVVVIDPGHGGTKKTGGSSSNNATSASGVLEKTMTLSLAKLVRSELKALTAEIPGSKVTVHLTRNNDSNLGLVDRAQVAAKKKADVFVSIHYNGFNGAARGTETWIFPESGGNLNPEEDRGLATRVQAGMMTALRRHDPNAKDRGVKDSKRLAVLRDVSLGNRRGEHATRACLVECEFIDVPEVDRLLNTGPDAAQAMKDLAQGIAEGILQDLEANA
ncbi:MAG: N-acetylmuramoyl-L-alanine amidase [Gammaproteobacteria bacterium]|nr:N-acetylmuramoyl-L-alanine amidase [Gammaproteobacteria bacterium]